MKQLLRSHSLSAGFALFSMFFGAGNLIFPLALGAYAGDKNLFAMVGLLITAVFVPFVGVITILGHSGDCHRFFARLGTWPGYLLSLAIIALIGPFGCTPRCIALSFSTVKVFFPSLSPWLFNALFCSIILLFTLRKNKTVEMLGKVLTPILLLGLGFIIVCGFFYKAKAPPCHLQTSLVFFHGLVEGYNTMDLLAAFFFSSTVIAMLKHQQNQNGGKFCHVKKTLKAALIGAFILSSVYLCFSFIAAMHADTLQSVSKDRLLTTLAMTVAGPFAGVAVSLTVIITCLTTAIALICVCSDFFHHHVFKGKSSYRGVLFVSLLVTFTMACIEFQGLSAFLSPILQVCYPGLIVLTFLSFFSRFIPVWLFRGIVFCTFISSLLIYALS